MTLFIIFSLIGAFGWGMYAQEIITKRQLLKARERRIIIDAPFSPRIFLPVAQKRR